MHSEHGFNFLEHLPLFNALPNHVGMSIIVAVLLVVTTFVARAQLMRVMRGSDGGLIPEAKMTYRNFFEIIAESLFKLTESVIGHDAPIYFPIIGTMFIFI